MQRGARGGDLFLHLLAICNISSSSSLPTAAKPLTFHICIIPAPPPLLRPDRLPSYYQFVRLFLPFLQRPYRLAYYSIINPALPSPFYSGQTALHITLFTFTKHLKGNGSARKRFDRFARAQHPCA
eukprot:2082191-Pyramimonas_sp.AAC.1